MSRLDSTTDEESLDSHQHLSDAASSEYDEYVKETAYDVIIFEEFLAEHLLPSYLKGRGYAVDLGCGTGRLSFLLAKQFARVSAYDISTNMLAVAKGKAAASAIENIDFQRKDLARDPIAPPRTVDTLFASFGFGSFLKDLAGFLLRVYFSLRSEGIAYLSFYNKRIISSGNDAGVGSEVEEGSLSVTLKSKSFKIPIYPYSLYDLTQILSQFPGFEILIFTVINQAYLRSIHAPRAGTCRESSKYIALVLCKKSPAIPRALASRDMNVTPELSLASVMCRVEHHPTPEETPPMSKLPAQLQTLVDGNPDAISIKRHKPVMTMADVEAIFPGIPLGHMLKAILVTYKQAGQALYCVCGVPADCRLSVAKLALLLQVSKNKIKFARKDTVKTTTGYPVGAISPLGLPAGVSLVVDSSFHGKAEIWCGAGVNDASLRVSARSLFSLTEAKEGDIAASAVHS